MAEVLLKNSDDSPDSLQRKSLADQLYEKLEHRIVSGDMPPGTRLSEDNIAEQFKVSRSPARDAAAKLELKGFAERLGLRDRRVTFPTASFVTDTYDTLTVLSIGRTLNGCRNATSEDHAALSQLISQMARSVKNTERYPLLAAEFRSRMRECCTNRQLLALSADFEKYRQWLVNIYLRDVRESRKELLMRRQKSLDEHREIARAFAARDLPALVSSLTEHVATHRDLILTRLASQVR